MGSWRDKFGLKMSLEDMKKHFSKMGSDMDLPELLDPVLGGKRKLIKLFFWKQYNFDSFGQGSIMKSGKTGECHRHQAPHNILSHLILTHLFIKAGKNVHF